MKIRSFFGTIMVLVMSMAGCKEPQPAVRAPEVSVSAGTVTAEDVEFYISATDADEITYLCIGTDDDMKTPAAQSLFEEGEVFAATTEPVAHTVSGLEADTDYTVYVAARKDDGTTELYSEVKKLDVRTAMLPKLLEFVSASKTGFSYRLNAEEGQAYMHTYLEGWYFEWQYQSAQMTDGEEFDASVFVWNMLAQYGLYGESAQEVNWAAGAENAATGDVAYLVPGIKYYALAAYWDAENETWDMSRKPEIISFMMEDPGKSDKTIDCSVYEISPTKVSLRMECDEMQVNFYMYDLYPTNQYKSWVAEKGIEGMMDYVSEYGYPKANTYTDTWTVEPGKSYMLCVYGVDYNGDEFYTELKVDVPLPEPKMSLSMEPYEREMNGYNTYNTLRVAGSFYDFIGLDYESSVFYLAGGPVERSVFDAAVQSAGLSGTLEELQADGETMYALGQAYFGLNPVYADEELLAQLKSRDAFEEIYAGLEPDTEYVYMTIASYEGKMMCRLTSALTDPAPQEDVEELETYKAYLGNWALTGQQTTDWSTYHTYNLRFERLTPNRSFKVYGWSGGSAGENMPFEASFDPETGKISIATPQRLGTVVVDDKTYEVHFVGKTYDYGDELIVLADYAGTAYTGSINGEYLHLISEFFEYANEWKDFLSMSYVLYDPSTDEYFRSEEFDLVYFQIKKASL